MELKLARELIACLPRGRTLFYYGRHGYAPQLLSYLVDGSASIKRLRQERFGKLLTTPRLKEAIQKCGSGKLDSDTIKAIYWQQVTPFILTLDIFDWNVQTSRRGVNLVLQLNFSRHHDHAFERLAKPTEDLILRCDYHPVMKPGSRELFRETLAWSRIDLDFKSDEALVEEIQSDWVREAAILKRAITRCRNRKKPLPDYYGMNGHMDQIEIYLDKILAPYLGLWREAMLSATLDFIFQELGIGSVYYHSHATGCIAKRIRYDKPPRSIYSQLPKKFCFDSTSDSPQFLLRNKGFRRRLNKISRPMWYRLDKPNPIN